MADSIYYEEKYSNAILTRAKSDGILESTAERSADNRIFQSAPWKVMKERCDREWPQRSFWCSLGKFGGGNTLPNNWIASNADYTAGWEKRTARATIRKQWASGERETHRGQPWQAASCRPICLDTRSLACTQDRLPWLGLKAVETPPTSCESCQALSALFPIAGARAANTVKKITIATNVATTESKV